MASYGASNFLSHSFLFLGIVCIFALSLGVTLGQVLDSNRESSVPSRYRWEAAVAFSLGVSLLAHLILMADIAMQPQLVLSALQGTRGASSALKEGLSRIPGITNLTQLYLIGLPLLAAYPAIYKRRPPKWIRYLFLFLVLMVFLRAFLGVERFALIEFAICWAIPRIYFVSHRSKLYSYLPFIGISGVFVLFAAAEYIRSWQAYKNEYTSYASFIVQRFLGYFATSANNAAGVYEMNGPLYRPWFTATWLRRLPGADGLFGYDTNPLTSFFVSYGNPEFNNPSGIFSPILDFGVVIGLVIWVFMGIFFGYTFSKFRRKTTYGIMMYPSIVVGLTSLNQIYYWGDPRFFPSSLIFIPMLYYIGRKK